MDLLTLKSIIATHKERFLQKKELVKREVFSGVDNYITSREVIFISGIRRSGKSSLLALISNYLFEQKKIDAKNLLFVNFEDERFLNFNVEDFEKLYQSYLELEDPKGKKYFFFDEIQNIDNWERWINRLYEFEDVKIFITGSNASLIGASVSTSLTGRNRQINLHPFSFSESLLLSGIKIRNKDLLLPEKIVEVKRALTNYMQLGGFPEVIKNKDLSLADQYFKDIIYRDIISNYNIRNIKELRELTLFLITNSGSLSSYETLRKTINAKNTTTIKNYLNILEDVYLIHSLPKFDYSIKKQIYNPKKYYVTDRGFYNAVSFKFSENIEIILENIVFEQLLRYNKNLFYWKTDDDKEIDFIVQEQRKLTEAYQVTYNLSNQNYEREVRSLISISEKTPDINCYILTYEQEEIIETENVKIEVLPIWKWLLQKRKNNVPGNN